VNQKTNNHGLSSDEFHPTVCVCHRWPQQCQERNCLAGERCLMEVLCLHRCVLLLLNPGPSTVLSCHYPQPSCHCCCSCLGAGLLQTVMSSQPQPALLKPYLS
jgi:hypothetical protein